MFLHPQTKEEYALAPPSANGRGYKGFTVYAAPDVTLEDDLKRRDLTINEFRLHFVASARDRGLIEAMRPFEDASPVLVDGAQSNRAERPESIGGQRAAEINETRPPLLRGRWPFEPRHALPPR